MRTEDVARGIEGKRLTYRRPDEATNQSPVGVLAHKGLFRCPIHLTEAALTRHGGRFGNLFRD
jgi:hypothetical protein